jgi:thiol-disulfide isomerase/thioredoxin
MRKVAVLTWLLLLLAGIIALFWRNEWVYRLPTPVPANYSPVQTGAAIQMAASLPLPAGKPVFLHFYNPECPCSRFNIPHFKALVKQYGSEVNFAIVPMTGENYSVKAIQEKFGLDIPVLSDPNIAIACGVYSTPQAVIIDTNQHLYYRGNYNKSRYCTDKKTEYARMGLDGLLHHNATIISDQFALKAYGCSLPKCTKP